MVAEAEPPVTHRDVQTIMESLFVIRAGVDCLVTAVRRGTPTTTDPRKRIDEHRAEWLRTDPLQQRLRELVEHHRVRADAEERAQREAERRESS